MHHVHQPKLPSVNSRRRPVRLAALALALALAARAPALETLKTYPTLLLKDGRVLSSVEVVNYSTTDVLVRHTGGATSLRSDLLPDQVVADLHLPAPQAPQAVVYDPAFLALADKPAVAVAAPGPVAPSAVLAADPGSNVSEAQLQAAATAAPTQGVRAPAGEGNLSETFLTQPNLAAAAPSWTTLAGRIAVALPQGDTHVLADIDVRAYPSDLLVKCLAQAREQSVTVAQHYRELAAQAVREGRAADGASLAARATAVADRYLDFMPAAPYSARSDAQGHFTLRHDLRDVRLLAVGRVTAARGDWHFAWIGLTPGADPLLTEANATVVTAPETNGPRFAAR